MDYRELHILAETRGWLAVNKPAGLITERSPFESPTVESLVYDYLKAHSRRERPYLGIVHRLDRVTSGVLLLAKKKSVLKALNEQFRERRIRKTYLALVEQAPPSKQGELRHFLYKDQKSKKAIIYKEEVPGAFSVRLTYRLLQESPAGYLLEIHPYTGKYHQIRAQLAFIGCPILGDARYGGQHPFREKAIALHASRLVFLDPQTEEEVVVEVAFPSSDDSKSSDE